MEAKDVRKGMKVIYNGYDKYGSYGKYTGEEMFVSGRTWNEGSRKWLFTLDDSWDFSEGLANVSAEDFELVIPAWKGKPIPNASTYVCWNCGAVGEEEIS